MNKITPIFNLKNKLAAMVLLTGALFLSTGATAQTKRFVKAEPAGTADGTSWDNASNDIQLMINNSVKGDTIWVAGGTYKPNRKVSALDVITPNDRDNSFVLKDSIQIFGGFAGSETLLSQRNLENTANASILSADFNSDDAFEFSGDTLNIANNAENAYHVIVAVEWDDDPLTPETRLDGFTITGGNANDPAFSYAIVDQYDIYRYAGGGILNRNACYPTLANLTITGNYAVYGGGAYNRDISNATYINVSFIQNVAQFGGGVVNLNQTAATYNNVTISGNRADAGGGMYNLNECNPSLINVDITDNFATVGGGGGIFNNNSSPVLNMATVSGNRATTYGGGIYAISGSLPVITNTDISLNSAPTGGGIYANTNISLSNVTISENEATDGNGGGFYNFQAQPVLIGVTFNENSATGFGGGMANWSGGNAMLSGGSFTDNTAANGAGVFNFDNSDAWFTHVTFTGNTATANGGGASNRQDSNPVFTNCLFANNTAYYGGGIYNYDNANPILTNLTIASNEALNICGGMANDNSYPEVRNTIIYGNTDPAGNTPNVFNYDGAAPVFTYSLVEGTTETWEYTGIDGGNNTHGNPAFADAPAGDFSLLDTTGAANKGNNAYFAADQTPNISGVITDLAGAPRFYEDGIVDLGAYELQDEAGLNSLSQMQVTAYPNPVVSTLYISAKDEITAVAVYNMLGQEVNSTTWNSTTNSLNMASLQAGSYVVKVTIGGATGSVPVVKK